MSKQDVINIVKRKISGTDYESQDILYAVEESEFYIRNYTGRWQIIDAVTEELPQGLNYIWADMAMGILKIGTAVKNNLMGTADTGAVKQIKEGDTTIEFVPASSGDTGFSSVSNLVLTFAPDLAPFRRLYPNVSEV